MKQRNGFSLVELLVVLGIIMALTALLAAGYRHLHRVAARTTTIAQLHVCRALLQEYQNRAGLTGIEAYSTTNPIQLPDANSPSGTPQKFPVYVDPAAVLNSSTGSMVSSGSNSPIGTFWPYEGPLDVTNQTGSPTDNTGDMSKTGLARYHSAAVLRTQDVMYLLMHVPANRTTVQSLPPKLILEAAPGSPPTSIDDGPVLLDGWGNPIVFVPRGGIYFTDNQAGTNGITTITYLVRSTGVFKFPGTTPPMTGNEVPFWASAGEDNDFTQGDDNLYSFDN